MILINSCRAICPKIMQDYHVTTFCAPPTIYRFLAEEDMASYDLSSLKQCTNAGEPLNPEIMEQFRAVTGIILRGGLRADRDDATRHLPVDGGASRLHGAAVAGIRYGAA